MRGLTQLVGGFLAGLAVGYVVAVLAVPREGTDARTRLQEGAVALLESPRRARDHVQGAITEGRRATAETRAELESSAGLRSEPRSSI